MKIAHSKRRADGSLAKSLVRNQANLFKMLKCIKKFFVTSSLQYSKGFKYQMIDGSPTEVEVDVTVYFYSKQDLDIFHSFSSFSSMERAFCIVRWNITTYIKLMLNNVTLPPLLIVAHLFWVPVFLQRMLLLDFIQLGELMKHNLCLLIYASISTTYFNLHSCLLSFYLFISSLAWDTQSASSRLFFPETSFQTHSVHL